MTATSLEQRCLDGVHELHRFLADWLSGRTERTEAAFEAFRGALAADFLVVHPSAHTADREAACADVWRGHGMRGEAFEIEIRRPAVRLLAPPHCLLLYEEWQREGAAENGRLATAWLRRDEATGAIEWVHLHETWLRRPGGSGGRR